MLKRLWNDDCGAVISTELALVMGIVVFGVVPGLAIMRNNIIEWLSKATPFGSVMPNPDDLRRSASTPPQWTAKNVNHNAAQSVVSSAASSNVNLVVNVQYPNRNDIPSP